MGISLNPHILYSYYCAYSCDGLDTVVRLQHRREGLSVIRSQLDMRGVLGTGVPTRAWGSAGTGVLLFAITCGKDT